MVNTMRVHLALDMVVCGTIRESGVSETDIVWAPDMLSLGPVTPPWEQKPDISRRAFWTSLYKPFHDMPNIPDAYDAMNQRGQAQVKNTGVELYWHVVGIEKKLTLVHFLLYLILVRCLCRFCCTPQHSWLLP